MAEIKHPGVFIEEIPSGVQTIPGVPTSITAFVGRTWRGPLDEPVHLKSFADYERRFGGLWRESTLGFAVKQFFENGGTHAIVVRVATRAGETAAKGATVRLQDGEVFRAADPGSWGLNLKVAIDHGGLTGDKVFNLTVADDAESRRDSGQRGGSGANERFTNLSVDPASPQFIDGVLKQSQLLRYDSGLRAVAPREQTAIALDGSGTDGAPIGTTEVTAPGNRAAQTGLYALDKAGLFNLLCIPPYRPGRDLDVANDWTPAARYCADRGAILIIDAPATWTVDNAVENVRAFQEIADESAALYFPRVLAPDPFDGGRLAAYAPCGMVAGVMSRTDMNRGVWQAPAGIDAGLLGVSGPSTKVNDNAQSRLSPFGINCLREFPDRGVLIWGAHTLARSGSSEWKYVNVRRFFLYIEESIDQGTQWVVFEPNSEPTWSAVVRLVETFLTRLWRAGALVGSKPEEAFYVRCDRSTMTQEDIDNGRLIAIVGIAPVRPAEFVILRVSQKTIEAIQ
jgi:phage tail sheath protein FI